jgi:hypothetical protein
VNVRGELHMQRSNSDKQLGLFITMDIHHVIKTILILIHCMGDITVKIFTDFEGLLKTCFCKFIVSKCPNHEIIFKVVAVPKLHIIMAI